MSDHRIPKQPSPGEADRPRNGPPDGGRGGNSGGDGSGPIIDLASERFLATGWPLLPYIFGVEADGSFVFFDHNFCPIVRIDADDKRRICYPLLIRRCVEWHFVYLPHERPQDTHETLVLVLGLVQAHGVEAEIIRRWHLSAEGRLPPHLWGQNWTWP